MPWVQYIGRRALAGDVLGPNLISNGHFTSGTTGWTAGNSTLSKTADGKLRITDAITGAGVCVARQSVTTVVGTLYRVDVDFTRGTSVAGLAYVYGASSPTPVGSKSGMATGSHIFYFIADATSTSIQLYASTGAATTGQHNDWDNVKIREVLTRGHATDIEHVTAGDFTYNYSTWTKGTGWALSGGVASSDGTQTALSNLAQQSAGPGVLYGKVYDTSITVSGYSADNVKITLGAHGAGTARTANGTYTQQITATTTTSTHIPGIFVVASADFIGSVDNISVKLASDNTWSLDFDIADMQPGRSRMANSVQTLDGSTDTQYWSSKKTLVVQTDILAYGEWQFLEEFADNAVDGQTVTFDPFGTESQPKAPGSYILTDYSLTRIIGADTTERRQYQLQFREA